VLDKGAADTRGTSTGGLKLVTVTTGVPGDLAAESAFPVATLSEVVRVWALPFVDGGASVARGELVAACPSLPEAPLAFVDGGASAAGEGFVLLTRVAIVAVYWVKS
jgi:hypothetical protein